MATFTNPRDRLLSDDLCLYKDQEHYKIDHVPLHGDINADVCIIGGGDSPLVNSKKDETRAFDKIYKRMTEVYPHMKNEHITHWWGGYFGVTKDQIPEIGRTEDGIYYAYGYSGHGVVPTHMAAHVLSDMIAGKLDANHFSTKIKAGIIPGAGKHDWILAKLALLWYGFKERFD